MSMHPSHDGWGFGSPRIDLTFSPSAEKGIPATANSDIGTAVSEALATDKSKAQNAEAIIRSRAQFDRTAIVVMEFKRHHLYQYLIESATGCNGSRLRCQYKSIKHKKTPQP